MRKSQALLLAVLPFFFVHPSANAKLVDKISAVVNADVILLSDIERFERTLNLRRELDPLFGFTEGMASGTPAKPKITDFLIQERLITQNFKVTDTEVEQEIQSVQRNNNLNREQLLEFLKTKGFGFNDYFELMRIGLSKRNLLDREIRTRVNVSDDDVRNYYYNMAVKNANEPLEYSIQLILVANSTYKNVAAAQDTAENALRSIKQGESFADIAKRFSDAPSASSGGEMGYVSADTLAEPLKSAVRGLQIGSLSNVIKTSNGFMIVKLLDARSTESEKFKAMKEQIREQLAKEEYKKQLVLWAERARNSAYVHVNGV
jgi:peptidyl-prolyl cis-trans isomerase SurA